LDPFEVADAAEVTRAQRLIDAGDVAAAEAILTDVVARAPLMGYRSSYEVAGSLVVKFWDHEEMAHFLLRRKASGTLRAVEWGPNAYPRACFSLAWIRFEEGDYPSALAHLDAGLRLEPESAHLLLEKARVVVATGDREGAIGLCARVLERGDAVAPRRRAVALRLSAVCAIDLGLLEEAEAALQASLTFDPESRLAKDELTYIARLRAGGPTAATVTKVREPGLVNAHRCARCGGEWTIDGEVSTNGGPIAYDCARCVSRSTKRWWRFWK